MKCPAFPRCACLEPGWVDLDALEEAHAGRRSAARPVSLRLKWLRDVRSRRRRLSDIALEAGVSAATVSLAITGTERRARQVCRAARKG